MLAAPKTKVYLNVVYNSLSEGLEQPFLSWKVMVFKVDQQTMAAFRLKYFHLKTTYYIYIAWRVCETASVSANKIKVKSYSFKSLAAVALQLYSSLSILVKCILLETLLMIQTKTNKQKPKKKSLDW